MTRRLPNEVPVPRKEPIELGTVRCITCGKVHDCYETPPSYARHIGKYMGRSWASRDDGHPYWPESWRSVASRYGFTLAKERAS